MGSNSKYAVLGSLRGVAQTISYEIRLSLILMVVTLLSLRLNLHSIEIRSSIILLICPMVAVLWFVMMIAETNRTPFDFSSVGFVLIFLAEYARILLFSSLGVRVFTGIELFSLKAAVASVAISRV